MVRPGYRRRRIFRQLFAAAKKEYQRLGVRKLILVCEQSSASGQAFVKTTGAQRGYAEHEMVMGTFKERRIFHEGFQMRQANSGDLDAIASILAADSGNVEEEKMWVGNFFDDRRRSFYLQKHQ